MNSESVIQLLDEILIWVKLQGMVLLPKIFEKVLDSPQKRKVYELTDGQNSVSDISKSVSVATGTISTWWSQWYAHGILKRDGKRYIKIISLKEIGGDRESG